MNTGDSVPGESIANGFYPVYEKKFPKFVYMMENVRLGIVAICYLRCDLKEAER